jgi:hypothetical protein
MTTQKNGMATAGMICGIVGIVGCWLFFIGPIAGLLGIIFGAIGLSRAGKIGGVGRGAAITGVVCGIVAFLMTGIVAAIAIPAFMEYMHKSKKTEASLHLKRIERSIKTYVIEKGELPPSAAEMPGPIERVCDAPDRKHPPRPFGDWQQDPGWGAIGFHIDEPSRFSFTWTRESATRGVLEARSDLDCDQFPGGTRVDIMVREGNVTATYGEEVAD